MILNTQKYGIIIGEAKNDTMPTRYRLTVYFSDEEILKKLEEWAKEENRSASNLAATILARAVQEKESKK
ncbi:ribbon-helix-helix domain-containing protein [Fischerella thermalis]|nr:hypothetical protein [Fischerella thermalis]